MKTPPQNVSEAVRKLNPHLYQQVKITPPTAETLSMMHAASNVGIGFTRVRPPKRIRQSNKPLLNKLEQQYCGYLTVLYVGHPVISQGMKFRLANGCWYCPDFVVWGDENNYTRAFEIKGKQPLQDDSVVKIKVAAKEYHWINWYLVWWQDGQWKEQLVIK